MKDCLNFTDCVPNMLCMRSAELRIVGNAVARKLITKVGHMERTEMYRISGGSNIVQHNFDSIPYFTELQKGPLLIHSPA
jgi:hypothetical protein